MGGGNEGQGNLSCGEMRVGLVFEGISVIATREIRGTAESGLISFFDVTFVLVCARLDRRETSEMKKCTPKTRRARVAGREKGVWVRLASNRFKRAKGRGREVRGNFRHQVASRRRDAAQPDPLAQNTKMVVARRGRKKAGARLFGICMEQRRRIPVFPLIWSRVNRTRGFCSLFMVMTRADSLIRSVGATLPTGGTGLPRFAHEISRPWFQAYCTLPSSSRRVSRNLIYSSNASGFRRVALLNEPSEVPFKI